MAEMTADPARMDLKGVRQGAAMAAVRVVRRLREAGDWQREMDTILETLCVAMLSEAFGGFYLSDLEYGVRTHHDHLRKQIPVLGLETAPEEKDMWALNDALRSRG